MALLNRLRAQFYILKLKTLGALCPCPPPPPKHQTLYEPYILNMTPWVPSASPKFQDKVWERSQIFYKSQP